MAKLSTELNRYFFEEQRAEKVTLKEFFALAEERIFAFLFIILALPSALPLPAPYAVPFGLGILFLVVQFIIGREYPWLPKKMLKGSMKLETVQGFVKKGTPWIEKMEKITKPRKAYICNGFPGRIIIGLAIALMSISMCIPIPGTNTVPAMGIFITAFGLLEDDGLICLLGLFVCSLGVALTSVIIIFGKEAVKAFIVLVKGYIIPN